MESHNLQAKGSTPMAAHISWNCDLNCGFLRISSRCCPANSSRFDRNDSICFDICSSRTKYL